MRQRMKRSDFKVYFILDNNLVSYAVKFVLKIISLQQFIDDSLMEESLRICMFRGSF